MRLCWTLFYIVLLMMTFAFVSLTVAQVHSNMISVMAASKVTGARTVLMLAKSDTKRFYPQVNELPTAVKFVSLEHRAIACEFHAFLEEQHCGLLKKSSYDFMLLPRIVYLPFVSIIPQLHERMMMNLWKYHRILFIISSEEHNRTLRRFSPEALCHVVSVTSRGINAPADRYRRCGQRVNVTASSLFAGDAASRDKFPKGRKYRAAVQFAGSEKANINTHPEVLAMMDAFRVLNNTIDVIQVADLSFFLDKYIDIVLLPVSTEYVTEKMLFLDAYYSPVRCCFYTRKRIDIRMAFPVSSKSFLEFLIALALVGAMVALCVHIRSRVLFHGRTLLTLPGFLLFMVGTFFGRCHAIPEAQAPIYRCLAVVSWMLGMFFLGNYVQTTITAIRVLPSFSAPIRTLEQLQPHIKTCAMAPCFSDACRDIFLSFSMPGFKPLFPILQKLALKCSEKIYTPGDVLPCHAKAQAGSHVVFSACSDQEISAASQWGLVPSDDLFTHPQLLAMHWLHPARYQHRRILFAIAEHGLAVPHRRRVPPQMIDQDPGAESFDLYFWVYLAGCAISCAALAAELLCRLKHRPRVGDIGNPDR